MEMGYNTEGKWKIVRNKSTIPLKNISMTVCTANIQVKKRSME